MQNILWPKVHKTIWTAVTDFTHKRVHIGSVWFVTPSEPTPLSLSYLQKASGVAVNKGALENNPSWENMLAGLPLCCRGHSVVPVSWASALTAAGVLQALTGKSHWVISKLHLFVHRFSWALWPPLCTPIGSVSVDWSTLTFRHTRVGYVQ